MKYQVILTKYEVYEVEAPTPQEALELAFDMDDNDKYSWTSPVDNISIKEID